MIQKEKRNLASTRGAVELWLLDLDNYDAKENN